MFEIIIHLMITVVSFVFVGAIILSIIFNIKEKRRIDNEVNKNTVHCNDCVYYATNSSATHFCTSFCMHMRNIRVDKNWCRINKSYINKPSKINKHMNCSNYKKK